MRTITASEFEMLLARHRASIPAPTATQADAFLARQLPNGKFEYQCEKHLDTEIRFTYEQCKASRALAAHYRDTQDERCRTAVARNLAYWQTLKKFPTIKNWVLKSVIIPRLLIDTLILMGDNLPQELRDATYQTVLDCYSEERYVHDIGANIVWMNLIWLHAGIYGKDQRITAQAAERMLEEMKFADLHTDKVRRNNHWRMYAKLPNEQEITVPVIEGVQRDYSFCEHGPLLYTAGYGAMYFAFCTKMLHLFAGMGLVPECHYQFIVNYCLEHIQWTYIYGRTDHATEGRAIARANVEHTWYKVTQEETVPECIDLLLQTGNAYRADELRHAKDAILAAQNPTTGTRYYPASKYMVHQGEHFSTTLRMTSAETMGSESVSWENMQGWHMGDGLQFVYASAKDYTGMFPAWDWMLLPGTTANQAPRKPLDYQQHIAIKGSRSPYCGGVNTQHTGACGMEMLDDANHAKKAWLQFANVCCCLGADITSSNGYETITTINQTLLQGDATISGENETQTLHLGDTATWSQGTVSHAGLAYTLLAPANASVRCETQTKDYNTVVHDSICEEAGEPIWVSKDVLNVTISHGIDPTSESYAYTVQATADSATQPQILRNDATLQAAMLGDSTLAIYWQPATLIAKNTEIHASAPCVLAVENGMITVGKLRCDTALLQIKIDGTIHDIIFDALHPDFQTFAI